jgi:hypothetical protein
MKSRAVFVRRVAARLAVCHKPYRFSAAHNIRRFDDR